MTEIDEHLTIACPTAYHITMPHYVAKAWKCKHKRRPKWVCLIDLNRNVIHAQAQYAKKNRGEQKIVEKSIDSSAGIIKAFGGLMFGNKNKKETHYTYVRCSYRKSPGTDDFHFEETLLPINSDCRHPLVYVPSCWATEVLRLVRRGVYLVTLKRNMVIIHLRDGTLKNYREAH